MAPPPRRPRRSQIDMLSRIREIPCVDRKSTRSHCSSTTPVHPRFNSAMDFSNYSRHQDSVQYIQSGDESAGDGAAERVGFEGS